MGRRRGQTHENPKEDELCHTPISEYEQSREERIRENLEKMKKLGIFELSSFGLKLNNITPRQPRRLSNNNNNKTPPSASPLQSFSEPTRRSSRLKNASPVIYSEVELSKKNKVALLDDEDLLGEEGSRPEIYTERHDKLLGSTKKSWTLFVDGYGRDGKRIYDQVKGKSCHQCRQKTLGYRTRCSQCDLVQGQFCGDCLYMRYGEHVLEAKENPNWICPACRGICNCSLCRQAKGWAPTGPLYRKITRLGFKSVAHYLIQTRRAEANLATNDSANENSVKRSLAFSDAGVQPGPSAQLEDKSDDKCSSEQPLLLPAMKPAFESIASPKEIGETEFLEKEENGTPKLNQTSLATIATKSDRIAGRSKARRRKGNAHDDSIPDVVLAAKKFISSQNKVEKQKEPVPADVEYHGGDDDSPLKTTPKPNQKLIPVDVPSLDSISGRLRSRRKVYNDEQAGNGVLSENETQKKKEEAVPSDIEHLSDENNPKTTPKPSLRHSLVVVVPSSDSIGGRLRQRCKISDESEMDNQKEEQPSDREKTPKLNQKRTLVVVPSSDGVAGRLRQRLKISDADEKEAPLSDIKHHGDADTSVKSSPKLKAKLALAIVPSSDSIGGRLRQRQKMSDNNLAVQEELLPSDIQFLGYTNTPLMMVPSSDSIGGRLRLRRKVSLENNDAEKPKEADVSDVGGDNSPLKRTPKRNQKLTLLAPISTDSIGGRLRLRRTIGDGSGNGNSDSKSSANGKST